jgi:protein SCO1/2
MARIRLVFLGVVVGLALVAGAALVVRWVAPPAYHGMVLSPNGPAGDFELSTAGARRVRLSEFRGKVVLLFFGYRFCPDVCPVSLTEMKHALEALGPQAEDVQVIMVSVDPERDSPDIIAEHVRRFDPRFLGLSGTPDEVAAAATPFGIFYERAAGSAATGYLVNHTATITALDRDGYVRVVFPHGTAGEDIAADVRSMLAGRYP